MPCMHLRKNVKQKQQARHTYLNNALFRNINKYETTKKPSKIGKDRM